MFGARMLGQNIDPGQEMDVTELIENLDGEEVEKIWMVGNVAEGKLKDGTEFTTFIPDSVDTNFYDNYLKNLVDSNSISFCGEPYPGTHWYVEMLHSLILIFDFVIFSFILLR